MRRWRRLVFDDWGSMRGWAAAASFFLTICLFIGVILVGVWQADRYSCHRTLDVRGLEGHYEFWAEGCYVHMGDGRVLSLDDVKPTQVELDTREGAGR